MRRLKRISFFLYSCLLLAVGFYGHYQVEQWFYPGRQLSIGQDDIRFFQNQNQPAAEAVRVPDRLSADTKLVVKSFDQTTKTETQETKFLPLRLIGCNREEVQKEILQYQNAPPLTELQQGLRSMELVSFSPQRIVISKIYRKEQQADSFFLQIEANRVVVYEEDSDVLYLQTAIDARTLPNDVRRQILDGWHSVSRAQLEKFLVSQTET